MRRRQRLGRTATAAVSTLTRLRAIEALLQENWIVFESTTPAAGWGLMICDRGYSSVHRVEVSTGRLGPRLSIEARQSKLRELRDGQFDVLAVAAPEGGFACFAVDEGRVVNWDWKQ